MSGVAGGSRIKKADVQKTFDNYIDQVLRRVPGYRKATLSGSVKLGTKPDYGDLDLVVWFDGEDKKVVKQAIIDTINALPTSVIVPFKSEKNKGKRYYNAGELISVLFPIAGKSDEFIQVDNIIALSEEEHQFKNNFLDLPAEKQGLLIGLAKVILQERDPKEIFQKLRIQQPLNLPANQEYEFNLSSVKLTLRKVTLDNSRKEIAREDLWATTDWNTISKLFEGFNIDGTFEELLQDLSLNLKNPRSKQRIVGVFRSMVSVKSGEVGTPKGDAKEKALSTVANTLAENTKGEVVALYGGGFKPPHKGHFANAVKLAEQADRLVIFIGPKQREGLVVTAEQSKAIWELYARYINKPVEIYISTVTPIRDVYEWAEANQDKVAKIITGSTKEEMGRFKAFIQDRTKYPKVEVLELPVITTAEDSKLSATNIRQSEEYLKSGEWLPDVLDSSDVKKIVKILLPTFESVETLLISNILEDFYKSTESLKDLFLQPEPEVEPEKPKVSTNQYAPKLDIDTLYDRVTNQLGDKYFDIEKEGNSVRVSIKGSHIKPKSELDLTEPLVGILEYALKNGIKLNTIPEIKTIVDPEESQKLLCKTAYYNPVTVEIVLYTSGRHPKDILRSFCHELIHHIQNEEGRLGSITTTNTNEDSNLQQLEEEAYLKGNMLFRNWEDREKEKFLSQEDELMHEVVNPDGEIFDYKKVGRDLFTYEDSKGNLYFARIVYQPTNSPYFEFKVGWFENNDVTKPKYDPQLPANSTALDNVKRRNTVAKIYRDEILTIFKHNITLADSLIIDPISQSRFIFSQRLVKNHTPKSFNVTEKEGKIEVTLPKTLKESLLPQEKFAQDTGQEWIKDSLADVPDKKLYDLENYTVEMVPLDKVKPSQSGDDYINDSSRYQAKQYKKYLEGDIDVNDLRFQDYYPIVVNRDTMEIIDGNHRHAAHTLLGLPKIKVILVNSIDKQP